MTEQLEAELELATPGLSATQIQFLMKPLHPSRVKTRSQGSAQLSYLEAWDVKATLIRIFGFGGFSAEVSNVQVVDQREVPQTSGNRTNWKVAVMATVRLTILATGAVYTETAVGSANLPDIGQSLDMATKTAESDALKRCATYLGTQFGLSLYDNGNRNEVVRIVVAPGQEVMPNTDMSEKQQEQAGQSLGLRARAAEGDMGDPIDGGPA